MTNATRTTLAGPGIMLFTAVLFGFFGFVINWNPRGIDGTFLWWVAACEWTLKGSALAFFLAAGISFGNLLIGNLVYSAVSLLGAILFIAIAVADFLDDRHTIANYAPILLLIFGLWNGFSGIQGLRATMAELRGR